MATVKFTLLRPYKRSTVKEPEKAKAENKKIKEKIKERKKQGKSIDSLLNPFETRIYVHLILDRSHMVKHKTDEKILPKKWDFGKSRAKNFPGSIELNQNLDLLQHNILNAYRQRKLDNKDVTWEEIQELFLQIVKEGKPKTRKKDFFSYYHDFIEAKSMTNKKGTLREYKNVLRALNEFNEMHNYKLTFEKVDMSFYQKFLKYLTEERQNMQSGEIGLRNDTIGKYIATIKMFMQWAYEMNYHKNTIYQNKSFNPYPFKKDRNERQQNGKKEIVTITKIEINQLEKTDFSNSKRMERVRDLFLFGCFTGQRWSDIENYRPEDIKNNAWEFEAHKTGKFTRVPFVGYCAPALNVLKKYEFELPKITNQEFNRVIKQVFAKAGLDREVIVKRYIGKKEIKLTKPLYGFASSHMARRTAVTMLLESGMSMLMVMKLTNHSDTRTLLKYENAGHDALEKALSNYEKPDRNTKNLITKVS
ncbi:site-specific integrase [Catalinimonas sp. 4WD22]|uniref:tyrosine-type recombinase/integrase n=1 Tax=Catalinimonas locisalis TaxID=3133978 RepID=UPI003101633F